MSALMTALVGQAGAMVVGLLVGLALIWLLGYVSDVLLSAMASGLFDYATNWITIPSVGQIILWGQAISIVLVVIIRIAVAINKGILSDEIKAPEYLFKSVGSVVLVAIMPIACNVVITAGHYMMQDVLHIASDGAALSGAPSSLDALAAVGSGDSDLGAALSDGTIPKLLTRTVVVAAAAFISISVYLELMVRQVQMLVVGCAAPWVGVKVATESDSGQYWDLLVGLLGMCLVQILQTFFLFVSLAQLATLLSLDQTHYMEGLFGGDLTTWYQTAIVFALLIGTKSIPSLLDRWTFAGSGGRSMAYIMGAGRSVSGMAYSRGAAGGAGRLIGAGAADAKRIKGAASKTNGAE